MPHTSRFTILVSISCHLPSAVCMILLPELPLRPKSTLSLLDSRCKSHPESSILYASTHSSITILQFNRQNFQTNSSTTRTCWTNFGHGTSQTKSRRVSPLYFRFPRGLLSNMQQTTCGASLYNHHTALTTYNQTLCGHDLNNCNTGLDFSPWISVHQQPYQSNADTDIPHGLKLHIYYKLAD